MSETQILYWSKIAGAQPLAVHNARFPGNVYGYGNYETDVLYRFSLMKIIADAALDRAEKEVIDYEASGSRALGLGYGITHAFAASIMTDLFQNRGYVSDYATPAQVEYVNSMLEQGYELSGVAAALRHGDMGAMAESALFWHPLSVITGRPHIMNEKRILLYPTYLASFGFIEYRWSSDHGDWVREDVPGKWVGALHNHALERSEFEGDVASIPWGEDMRWQVHT